MQAIHEHIIVRVPRPKTAEGNIQLVQQSVLASHSHGLVESVGNAVKEVKAGDIVLFDTDGGVRDIELPGQKSDTSKLVALVEYAVLASMSVAEATALGFSLDFDGRAANAS